MRKLIIIGSVFVALFLIAEFYLQVQEHNLNVISKLTDCVKVYANSSDDAFHSCADRVKKLYVPKYH